MSRAAVELLLNELNDIDDAPNAIGYAKTTLANRALGWLTRIDSSFFANAEDRVAFRMIDDYFKHRRSLDETEFLKNLNELKLLLVKGLAQPIAPLSGKFKFIGNLDIAEMLERDLIEAQKCFEQKLYKSCAVMCGSILEAALYGILRRDASWTMNTNRNWSAFAKPLQKDVLSNDFRQQWKFSQLIDFTCDNEILNEIKWRAVLHQKLREPRNLVHPTVELRSLYLVNKQAANSSLAVLHEVLADLNKLTFPLPP